MLIYNALPIGGLMKMKKVGVVFGGVSAEHDISIATAKNVVEKIQRDRYQVFPIYISKSGEYVFGKEDQSVREVLLQKTIPICDTISCFQRMNVVFNALHGPFGEDGVFQGFLKTIGVACTGSESASSSLAMDKMRAKFVMQANDIPVPKGVYLKSPDDNIPFFPVAIKPNQNGSSYGISIVKRKEDLEEAIKDAFKYDDIVIAEELLTGQEITCAVMEKNKSDIKALPVTLIEPKVGEFFDLRAKYEKGGSIETTPAPISKKATLLAQELALRTHKAIGCNGITRTDMFLDKNDNIKVIEINTLPGMTDTSLVPQAASVIGISFPELLSIIIEEALNR